MKLSIQDKPALLLVDIQKGFSDVEYWGGHRNNPDAEIKAAQLLELWRENNMPVFHVKHCSITPQSPLVEGKVGNEFQEVIAPIGNEPIMKKNVNSAFIGTDLKERLEEAGIKQVVVVGLTTDHCISTTVRMAGNLGFETFVVNDATATFDKISFDGVKHSAEVIHATALASLHEEFATVLDTTDIVQLFD